MNDINQPGNTTPSPSSGQDDWFGPTIRNVQAVYALYLLSFLFGITSIIGVVFAHINRANADAVAASHYTYQIRTFWIGLLFTLIGFVLAVVLIGFLIWIAVAVWVLIRCIKGLQLTGRNEAVPDPGTWLI